MIKAILLTAAALFGTAASAGFGTTDGNDGFLKVDDAFRIQPLEYDGQRLRVSWEIAPEHYLYRKRLEFKLLDPADAKLPAPQLPQGVSHHDEHFGTVEIYRSMTLNADFPWPKTAAAPRRVQVRYQGCAEAGICYPPQTRILDLSAAPVAP